MSGIRHDDAGFAVDAFLALAQRVWPRTYDRVRAGAALERITNRGIGRALMDRSLAHAPRGIVFFGAQPEAIGFFERLGCARRLTGFTYGARRPDPERGIAES